MTVYDIRPIQISMPSREPPAFVLYIHIYIYTHYVSTIHDWLAEVCCVLQAIRQPSWSLADLLVEASESLGSYSTVELFGTLVEMNNVNLPLILSILTGKLTMIWDDLY